MRPAVLVLFHHSYIAGPVIMSLAWCLVRSTRSIAPGHLGKLMR